jgi:hypothetical protein
MANPKIAIVVRDDLAAWQALNITAFLASGLAAGNPELIGDPYEDADGTKYCPMFGHPVLVFEADAATLKTAHARALDLGLVPSVYTAELFATGNDLDNRAAVRAARRDDLNLVGLGLHGPRNAIDKAIKGACLYRT